MSAIEMTYECKYNEWYALRWGNLLNGISDPY